MKNTSLFIFFLLFANVFGQTKTNFADTESLLYEIKPDKSITSWMLIFNEYGRDKIIKSTKKMENYSPQESGFQLIKNEDQFYYIVYSEGNETKYITDFTGLKSFLGTIDNPQEAAIIGILEGYFLDSEFKNLAGNFISNKETFVVELGKITTTKCPLAKNSFELTIEKKSGKITSVKDNGVYNEVYDKTCANNPHNAVIEEQMKDAEAKKVQDAIENKEAKAKAKKKLMKSMQKK